VKIETGQTREEAVESSRERSSLVRSQWAQQVDAAEPVGKVELLIGHVEGTTERYFGFAEEQFQKSRKRTYPFDELVNLSMSERDFEKIVHRNIRQAIVGEMSPENALQQAVQDIAAFSVTV